MNNRVLFKVNASGEIGYGHFKRCLSLVELLSENNFEIYIQTNSNNPFLTRLCQDASFNISLTDVVGLEANFRELINEAKKQAVGWVVLDGYEYDVDFERKVMQNGFKLFRIADTPTHKFHCDVLLSPNYGAENMGLQTSSNAKTAFGLQYFLAGKNFRKFHHGNPMSKPNLQPMKILITLGGSNEFREKLVGILLNVLEGLNSTKLEFDIILGSEFDKNLKENYYNTKAKVRFFDLVSNIEEHMIRADFAICSAGTTMWELAYLGVPFGVLPLNDVQAKYVITLEKANLCLSLPEASRIGPEDIFTLIQRLESNPESLRVLANNLKGLMDREAQPRNILNLFA